jgi:hypothetical protein
VSASKFHKLTKNDYMIGCPLCLHSIPVPSPVLDADQAAARTGSRQ